MDIKLSRIDYALVGSTSKQTMKLLPNIAPKTQQKVALGDHDGVIQIFNIRRGDILHSFKSLPGPKISRLELGGSAGMIQDKIFVASESEVRGYTKKGKSFLTFETNMTEAIQCMSVSGTHLLVAGKHAYYHYDDCVEKVHLALADDITDIIALPTHDNRVRSVLSCEDRTLRLVQQGQRPVVLELPSKPTALQRLFGTGGESGDDILYGAQDGRIGLVTFGFQTTKHWVLESSNGAVVCMDHHDMTGDGVPELIVGRDDGLIEAYAFDEMHDTPVRRLSHACNESIMSIQGGLVSSAEHEEIVATTYTGWLFGLTTENREKEIGVKEGGAIGIPKEARERIQQIRGEIEALEQKVVREREKYQESTHSKSDALSAIPFIAVNDKFTLHRADASYLLSIEVQTAIDNVLIQSNVPVEILDVEKNSAVVSHSECDPQEGNYMLATYRCQVNTTRLEVRVRTVEGQCGELRAYVTLMLQPKCCQVLCYPIRPLSLHARTHDLELHRPYNTLRLAGAFSLAEIHTWISLCVPEVPEKPPLTEEGVLSFSNTLLGTILHCMYTKGKAEFKSDNMTTISILKDFMTKEATKRKIKVEISCDVNESSTTHVLGLLHPLLETQKQLTREASLLEALRELRQSGAELPPEHRRLLDNETRLMDSLRSQPAQLNRLTGMVSDLFVDTHKFKGSNVKSKVPQLQELVTTYRDLQTLIEFYNQY